LAAENGHAATVSVLLAKGGIEVNAKDEKDKTALVQAVQNGHKEIVTLLLAQNADVNSNANYNWVPLIYASYSGHKEIAEQLLAKGAEVNAQEKQGKTALMLAVQNGHKEIVTLLLAKGANVNAKDEYGKTALMLAAQNGRTALVQQLLVKGADVNAQDEGKYTALIWALFYGHSKVVDVLRAHGATLPLTGTASELLKAHDTRRFVARAGLMLLGAGLVGVGLMFGLGYILPALSFGTKLTASIASASTVLLLGYGIDRSTQAAHNVQVSASSSTSVGDLILSGKHTAQRQEVGEGHSPDKGLNSDKTLTGR